MSLETAFKNAVARVTDQRGKPATLGKSDGNTLHWTDLNGMTHRTRVWARVGESASNQAVVVDCIKVPPQIDMPVRVDYVNGVLSVVDVDYKRAVEFGGGRPPGAGGAHAWMHSRLGPDPVYIEGLQYLPLLVTPTNPADLTVTVQAGAYYDLSGDLQVFDTAVSGSTSAYVPASEYHFVIICLDRSDGSIVIVDGDDIAATDVLFSDVAVTAADVEAITISADYWPLAVVLLAAGQTQIKAKEIVMDLRPIGSTPGGSVVDVDDLTTDTGSSGEMVRVAAAGGLEYRTESEVLSDIGAAAAADLADYLPLAGGTMTGNIIMPASIIEPLWVDMPLFDSANDSGITSHFRDNDSSYPAGWTEVDAPGSASVTDSQYSFWTITGTPGDASWKYRIQSSVNIESTTSNNFNSFVLGPITFRDGGFPTDIDIYMGIYRDNSGIDENTFCRVHLQWSSSGTTWRVRGETKDGTTQTDGSWNNLSFPPLMPIYVRTLVRNNASKTARAYIGRLQDPLTQSQIANASATATWGAVWYQVHMTRGAGGVNDYMSMGALDFISSLQIG